MEIPTPETLRRVARRFHELSRSLAMADERRALDGYAEVLDQQADDLEDHRGAPTEREQPPTQKLT